MNVPRLVGVMVAIDLNILTAGDTLGNSQHRQVNSPVVNIGRCVTSVEPYSIGRTWDIGRAACIQM